MAMAISEFTGEPVDTASPEWRHECECAYYLEVVRNREERLYRLFGVYVFDPRHYPPSGRDNRCVAAKRGLPAAAKIREDAMRLFDIRKAAHEKVKKMS